MSNTEKAVKERRKLPRETKILRL